MFQAFMMRRLDFYFSVLQGKINSEGNAGGEIPRLGHGDGGGHQRLVLRFVAGVASKKAPPGELGDLFGQAAVLLF